MCDPTIATCPTEFQECNPNTDIDEIFEPPVCMDETAIVDLDAYDIVDGGTSLTEALSESGSTAYFQDLSTSYNASLPFVEGVTYTLADPEAQLLPTAVQPYSLMLQSSGLSLADIGFRVRYMATSTGTTIPQFEFVHMSSAVGTMDAPAGMFTRPVTAPRATTGGPGGGPANATLVELTTTMGTVAAILLIDSELLRPLVDEGKLPNGARGPILFSSALLGHQAMASLGLTQPVSLSAVGHSVPPFIGYQVMSMMLLDYAGVEVGTQQNEYGSIVAGAGTMVALNGAMRLATTLEARAALVGVRTVQGVRLARGAAALRALSVGGRAVGGVVGGVTLFDLALGGINWGVSESISNEGVAREYRLLGLADRMISNESMGFWPSMFCGNIFAMGRGIGAVVSDDFDSMLDEEREREIRGLVEDSQDFGTQMEDMFFELLLTQAGPQYQEHLESFTSTGPDGQPRYDLQGALQSFAVDVDWDGIEDEVSDYYRENREGIESHYDFLEEYSGGRAPNAETIRLNVSIYGSIFRGPMTTHLYRRAYRRYEAAQAAMHDQAVAWGLARELPDGRYAILQPDRLTPAQQIAYRTRIVPQMVEMQRMQLIMRILGPDYYGEDRRTFASR